MIVTFISLACYGTAIIYYKHLTNQKTFHQCGNADVNASYVAIKYQENCNMIHRKSARIITALLAMLITVSVVECIVSLLVLMRSKKLLRCCKRFCTLQTEVCESQVRDVFVISFISKSYWISKKKSPFTESPIFDYKTHHEMFFFIRFDNDPNIFEIDKIVVFIT